MSRGIATIYRSRVPVALAALCLGACASNSGSVYVHPNADVSAYRRIAVLPLETLAPDRYAGERMRDMIVLEMAALGAFEVVDVGEVNRVLAASKILKVGELGPEQIAQLGGELEVQGLLFGTVVEYGERRSGTVTAPEVALSMRLVDVESGIVAWSVSDARTGMSLWTRLFGVGQESHTEVARELVRELLDSLLAAAGR